MSDNTNATGAASRQQKRYDASHPAVLKIDGFSAFDCRIEDFSESGFYIPAGGNDALKKVLSAVTEGTKLVVEYRSGPKSYAIEGSASHLSLIHI